MKLLRPCLVVTTSSLLLLGAVGCSNHASSDSSPSATGTSQTIPHNAADVAFAQQMIPHHEQAIQMADMIAGRTQNAQLTALANQIKQAQGPEIQQLQQMLQSWGAPTAAPDNGGHGSHMDGMMTPEQMQQLQGAAGTAFDKMWLEMMIEHHEGAIEMAQTELAQGVNPEAKQLAQAIITAQQQEIATMQSMLK